MPALSHSPLLRRLLWSALVVSAIAALLWWLTRPEPVPVRLVTVSTGVVEDTVANTRAGTVKACRRARLSLQAGGRVAELHVREGDRVKQGALLLRLEAEDRQAQLAQATAQVGAVRAREQQACNNAAFDRRELKRLQELARQQLVAMQALDAADTRAQASADSCEAARAELAVAQAQQRLLQSQLAQTELRAPFAGIVAEVNGEVGEFATPSPPGVPTPPAVDLIDDSCLYVTAPVDEVDAARLAPGQPARISLDAYRGRHFEGRVVRLAPYVLELEKQARTVAVDVEFATVPGNVRLLAGQSADIEVILKQETLLRVPTEAVLEGGRVLRYQAASGRLESVAIDRALSNWSWTGVEKGLADGDRVAVSLERKGVADGAHVVPDAD